MQCFILVTSSLVREMTIMGLTIEVKGGTGEESSVFAVDELGGTGVTN